MKLKMPQVLITSDIRNKEFYFIDDTHFVLLSEKQNDRNYLCVFDDKLCDMARDFADRYTPELTLDTEKSDCLFKSKIEYWTKLFNIGIWLYLEKKNKIIVFSSPQKNNRYSNGLSYLYSCCDN